jgi:hypothetical protein
MTIAGSASAASATPVRLGAGMPVWVDRSIPGASAAVGSVHVGAGDPSHLSAVVTGSALLYSSQDAGNTWNTHASVGAQPFKRVIASKATPSVFYALDAASRIYQSTDSGLSWGGLSLIVGPSSDLDSGSNASALVAATGSSGLDMPLVYSTNGGLLWNNSSGPASFWSRIAGNPSTPDAFFAARDAALATPIAASTNGGFSWTDCGAFPMPLHVTALVVLPNNGPVLAASDTPGAQTVYRSNDSGGAWSASATGIAAGEHVQAIASTPYSQTAYATTDKSVYASYDNGTTWSDISSNLPEKSYVSVSASGGSSNSIYVGAADGKIYQASTPLITGINPSSGSVGDRVTISGLNFGDGTGSYVMFAGVQAVSYSSWTDTRIIVTVPGQAMSGELYVVTPRGSSNPVNFTLAGPPVASYSWYLAEGCTGEDGRGAFETWVLVQNPGDTIADVTVTFMTAQGPMPGPTLSVRPDSRQTISVAEFVPDNWSVSTRLRSNQPVIAERSVYWNATGCYRQAATDSIGVTQPETSWYLAEGCTGITTSGLFETWVLVQNPGDQPANVKMTYMTPLGPVAGPSFTLEAQSRRSVDVADTLPDCWSVSTSVTSDTPVVAERSMYLNTKGCYRQAATDSIGVKAGALEWYLAEGSTGADGKGSFETWVLVQNPGTQTAHVRVTYMTPNGAISGPSLELSPMSRQTVGVADTVKATWDVSTKVTSDVPVIAERAMYWSTPSCYRQAATDSIGVTSPQRAWCLAEGCTGVNTQGSFETWVLVQNPNDAPATVSIKYMTAEGAVTGPSLTLAANTRRTINVADTVAGNWNVSTRLTGDQGVIVERAMYWNSAAQRRQAAHDSIGVAQ